MADTLFAVGRFGHIWHRSDTGVWTNHSIGAMGASDHFYAVHGVSANEVYAIGCTGTSNPSAYWFYKWNGSSWNTWSDAPSVPSYHFPTSIFCFASDDIFFTYAKWIGYGVGGGILHWNGSSWDTIYSGSSSPFTLWGTASNNMYIGLYGWDAHPRIFKWNGSTLTASTTVGSPYSGYIAHLWGSSSGSIFGGTPQISQSNYGMWQGTWDSFTNSLIADLFQDSVDYYGWHNLYSANGKAWYFGVKPSNNYPCVAIYNGSSWSVTTLKEYAYFTAKGVTGVSDTELACVYSGDGGVDAAAFIWDGSSWSEEAVGDGGSFYPTDAWASSIPAIDTTPPEWANLSPDDGDTHISPTTIISLDIIDTDAGIDEDSVDISVEGSYAWHNDAEQTGFSVVKTAITDGFNYSITPDTPFTFNQVVDIDVYAEDLAGTPNVLDDSYSFTTLDYDEPALFVIGQKGHIWHRSAAGVWSNHNIGAMSTNDHFYGIHGLSNNEVYAVGFTGTSSISTCWYYKWNGSTWSVWTDAPSLAAGYGPTAIYCFASDSIFLTYTNGNIATAGGILYWNGSTWSTIDSGSYKPYNIWGTAANNVYFGCRIVGACEIKKWNGSSIANSSSVGGGDHINNLYGSSDGTLFACGECPFTNGIWKGVWDTLSATVVANIKCNARSATYGWNNIFSNNGKAWAFGCAYLNNDHPIVAVYDGSWATSELKNQRYSNSIAIAGISDSELIAIYGDSSAGNIPPNDAAAFIWDGSTWSEEGIGDGGTFGPTDAWGIYIPTAPSDTDPPEWDNLSPDDTDVNVPIDTTISLDITDPGSGVDENSVNISVEGAYAWHNNAEQTGFSVVKSSITDGYRYVITPDSSFSSFQTVDIDVYAEDLASTPNVLDDSYYFRTVDLDDPIWANLSPNDGDTQVSVDTTISIDILDYGDGVDASTVDISVEGAYAWHNDAEQTGFSVVKTSITNGYRYVITPDTSFDPYQHVDIDVYAEDLAPTPNVLDDSYYFVTADSDPPEWANLSPNDGDIDVSLTTTISLDILDYDSGVDVDSVYIRVEGVYAWLNDTEQTGFSVVKTSITDGYRYVITPDVPFASYQTVDIDIYAEDLEITPNVLDDSYYFRTVDVEAPEWDNLSPDEDDVNVPVDTTISLDILDYGYGVDASSVYIKVEGVYAWLSDTEQAGFSVVKTPISNGYRYVITPDDPLPSYTYIDIDVYAEDSAPTPNVLNDSYSFRTADEDAPVWDNLSPDDTDINVPVDTTISLDILDYGTGVDATSVYIKVEGVYAWLNDTEQTGFSVVKYAITNGYRYVITPDSSFSSYQTVDIDVYAEDLEDTPNVLNDSYSFRIVDTEAPYLANQDPAPDDTGISPLTSIYLDVLDDGDPVDASSVIITIDGTIAWQSDALQNGYTGSKSTQPKGYRYTLTPPSPLPMLTLIEVNVQASDTAPTPNALNTTYSFTTTTDIPPEVRNIDPANGETDVAADSKIEFDAWDNVGIDEGETVITVNSTLAYQSSSGQNSFIVTASPIVNGYHYEVTSPTNWLRGTTVTVQVYIKDTLGVIATKSWVFEIYGIPDCFTGPINSFEASLLVPYDRAGTTLYYTETLRNLLLNSMNTYPDPIRAIRQIYLCAFNSELAPMLRNIVVSPTTREKTAKLCYKRTIVQIDNILRSKPNLLRVTLAELRSIGLPVPHNKMLYRYLSTDEPNTLVPLACIIVILAKALEVNALS